MSFHPICLRACCLAGVAMMPPGACAERGRISFSGAIRYPTCSISTADAFALTSSATFRVQRMVCSKTHEAVPAARAYLLIRTRLTGAMQDQVLNYFVTYVTASEHHATDPVLLTQIYE